MRLVTILTIQLRSHHQQELLSFQHDPYDEHEARLIVDRMVIHQEKTA